MKRTLMVVSSVLILSLCVASGQEGPSETRDALADEVKRIAGQLEDLAWQLDQIAVLLAEMPPDEGSVAPVVDAKPLRSVVPRGLKPDRADLEAISRPTRWTEEELRDYIADILEVSSLTHHFFENDPQIQMLAEVGPENLDLLLEALGTRAGVADRHLFRAVSHLANEEHRELILEHLHFHPGLASIVVLRGWEEQASDIFIEGLYRERWLTGAWLSAVARLDDERVYEGLATYMIHGGNPSGAYRALRTLPDVDLDRVVAETWESVKVNQFFRLDEIAPLAAERGLIEGLVSIARSVLVDGGSGCQLGNLRKAIKRLVAHEGSEKELATLVLENTEQLWFDPVTKQYGLD